MNVIELIVCIFHFEGRRPVFELRRLERFAKPSDIWHTCWILIKDSQHEVEGKENYTLLWRLGKHASLNFPSFLFVGSSWFSQILLMETQNKCQTEVISTLVLFTYKFSHLLDKYSTILVVGFSMRWLFYAQPKRGRERSIDKFKCQFHNKCARARIDAIKFKLWVFIHLQMSFVAR